MKIHLKIWIVLTALLFFVNKNVIYAQFLKNVLNSVKQTGQNNTTNKVDQITNNTLNKVENLGKKKPKGTTTSSNNSNAVAVADTTKPVSNNAQAQNTNTGTNNANNAAPPNNPYNSDGSFITLKVFPTKVILKNSVSISGASLKYQNLNKVVMTITAENKVSQSKDIPLKDDGTFSTTWQPGGDGDYNIQVKSSDGKALQNKDITVYELEEMDSVTDEPKKEMLQAFDNLKKDIDALLPMLSSKDASDLKNEMTKVTQRKDTYLNFLNSMDDAGKQLDALEKQQGPLPPAVVSNFSKATDQVLQISDNMKQANAAANHEPYDNTVCEYLAMVKEACAAFVTISGFFEKSVYDVLKNIAIGNAVPGVAGAASDDAGIGGDTKNIALECTKMTATAASNAKEMVSEISKGAKGFAGDLGAMCADHYLGKYCTLLSGDLSENYQCTLRNKNSRVWWDYGYTTSATISLRSPKGSVSGGMMKMKGNIEGNATHFSIYTNPKEMDDFQKEMKGKDGYVQMYAACLYSPPYVPFSSAKADKNTGFGAVARGIATPAYFNIPIDADYDVGNKKLTIYVNDAIVDFGPQVSYVYIYVAVAAGIPIFTRVNYPINKVKLTLGKVISDNSTFTIGGSEEKPAIKGTGKTHLGDASTHIEQKIDFTFGLQGNE